MSNANRKGITLRFNLVEQDNLRNLCMFYNMDEKTILKFAFDNLIKVTNEINKRMQKEKEDEKTAPDNAGADDSVQPSDEGSEETAGADTTEAGANDQDDSDESTDDSES